MYLIWFRLEINESIQNPVRLRLRGQEAPVA